ncbi:M48 family metalloprotease [Pedobacter sp. GSP4]|uniref:M48 family metallopeptidase n=1 Tax=Pedobacter sp. GSP4 TaxID=3453716 RepID=UPI003EE8AAF7
MLENALKPSDNFKKMAAKSVQAIGLFIATYTILVIFTTILTATCCYLGIKLMEYVHSTITFIFGIGLIGFGFMILFFLIKFVFKSNKVDRSHLLEITRDSQPGIFKIIDEIVSTVKTDFPKKVYLSSEVNASVFYDSNFWSMFFPVRKNLTIGFGLINTTTANELRAILAHEFGHFSQRSMKVGIYVYQFNKVIHDMLYDNESYDKVTRGIAGASSYIGIFVLVSDKIIGLMQQILVRVYQILSASYSKLSHEMEFHADAVAAVTVGSKPLVDSLLRMQLASHAIDVVCSYYERKIDDCVTAENIFPNQILVMDFLAKRNKMPFENGFPQVSIGYYNRFNKSKISFSNQYTSHPETEERIDRLNQLGVAVIEPHDGRAISLLIDQEKIAEKLTAQIFQNAVYQEKPIVQDLSSFEADFLKENDQNSYPQVFNGYFDYRNPYSQFKPDVFEQPTISSELSVEAFFDDSNLSVMYELNALESDLATIEHIDSQVINVKTFNYDGKKYSLADCRAMIDYLKAEINTKNEELAKLDNKIFEYFRFLSEENQSGPIYKALAIKYKQVIEEFSVQQIVYADLANATRFMHTSASKEVIKRKMVVVKNEEKKFKDQLADILQNEDYTDLISAEFKLKLEDYLKYNYKYFGADLYFDEELKELFFAMNCFAGIISERHFLAKKELLSFNATLANPVFS